MNKIIILKVTNVLLHLLAAVHLSFATYKMSTATIPSHIFPIDEKFSGKWKYLTFWNVAIESVYFIFAILEDLISKCKDNEKKPLRKIRDYWFLSIVYPLSFFVSFTFWVLFHIDRELVMPRAVDAYFPSWANQSVHTFIFIYSTVELCTSYHRTLDSIWKHFIGLWAVTVSYLIWCNVVYYKTEMWVYPLLKDMNWFGRAAFFGSSLAACTLFSYIGYHLNTHVWKKKIQNKHLTTDA